jgi:hypothetical protein
VRILRLSFSANKISQDKKIVRYKNIQQREPAPPELWHRVSRQFDQVDGILITPQACRRRYFDLISQPGFDHKTFNLEWEEGDKKPEELDLHREFIGKANYPAWQPLPFIEVPADSDDGAAGEDAMDTEVGEKRGKKRMPEYDPDSGIPPEWKRQRARLAEEMMLVGTYMEDDEGELGGQDEYGEGERADQEADGDDDYDDEYDGNIDPRLRRPATSKGKGKGKGRARS